MNSAARRRRHAALRYGRLVAWLVSGALLIAFVSYVALPFGLALYIPQLAAQHGISLHVDRVRTEPFRSTLRLSGVRIATSAHSSIEWSNVESRIDLAELMSGRLVLDDFRLSEAKLHAGDPEMDTVYRLPDAVLEMLPAEVSVGEFVIDDVELATLSEALRRPVTIDWLRISSLDDVFRPGGADVQADASIGQGRSRLEGRLGFDSTGWNLDAEVSASEIPLDGIPALLGAVGSWRGSLDGSGPVRLVYSPLNRAFNTTSGGRWAVEGLELELAETVISGARVDWDGAAFIAVSDDAVNALSVDADIRLHELEVGVVDVLEVEATEVRLKVDASRAPAPRLILEGNSPSVRISGKGGAYDAIGAEATNLASVVALTFSHGLGVEADRLAADALVATLPFGRSVDIDRLVLERIVVEPDVDAVTAAAAAAERVDWRGFTAPRSSGTANRVSIQGLDHRKNGELRLARASAEAAEDRNEDADLRLRDLGLDATTLSPTGAKAIGGVRVADAWLASNHSTLVLEQFSLQGVKQDEDGMVTVASGSADVLDYTLAGRQTTVGSGLELAGATVSGRAWEADHIRLARVDVETGIESYALRELALIDSRGDAEQLGARLVRLGALEHGFEGNRIVVEDSYVAAPAWRDGAGSAQALAAASVSLDTVDRHRWQSSGLRLIGVAATASGSASADAASADSLALKTAEDTTAGAQGIELRGVSFDGQSSIRATSALAAGTHYRTGDGFGADTTGVRTSALEWDGDTLAVEQGTTPLASIVGTTAQASFDIVELTSARLGTEGVERFGVLTCTAGRGRIDSMRRWSIGRSKLGGYDALITGETTLDFFDALDVDVIEGEAEASRAHLRVDRVSARGTRIDSPGATLVANAEVGGMTLLDTGGREITAARMLQANRMTIRDSEVDIGSLVLSGIESTIGLSEHGDLELPVLPIATGGAESPIRLRIQETVTADSESVLHFIDRTTEPDFAVRVAVANAALHGFDSEAIGVPADFSVEADSGAFTALRIGGLLTPTLTGTDLDLNATIRGLSLPMLSPYARTHLGQDVEDGYADVVLDLAVRTSDLEGVADFTLSRVTLGEPASPTGSTGLDAALASLEDANGRVELRVPLRGKLDDPGFDFDGLAVEALARTALENAGASPETQ